MVRSVAGIDIGKNSFHVVGLDKREAISQYRVHPEYHVWARDRRIGLLSLPQTQASDERRRIG
jgi:hypothetical protein